LQSAFTNFTEDKLLGGRVMIRQPKTGYRVAIDPVLLAAAVPAESGQNLMDLGSGTGAVGLCAAARVKNLRVCGFDSNGDYVQLSQFSAEANGFDTNFIVGDVAKPPAEFEPASFDWATANPPYYDDTAHSPSPDSGKTAAHAGKDLHHWASAARHYLKPDGIFFMIFPGAAETLLFESLTVAFSQLRLLRIFTREDGPATRIIVAAQGHKGQELRVQEAGKLVLHTANGGYTPEARAVLWDAAGLKLAG
jgi:tRNA1(Val) A37 N6-methylase TrmN6